MELLRMIRRYPWLFAKHVLPAVWRRLTAPSQEPPPAPATTITAALTKALAILLAQRR